VGNGGHCCISMGAPYLTFWENTDTPRISARKHTQPQFLKSPNLLSDFLCVREVHFCVCVCVFVSVCVRESVFCQRIAFLSHSLAINDPLLLYISVYPLECPGASIVRERSKVCVCHCVCKKTYLCVCV